MANLTDVLTKVDAPRERKDNANSNDRKKSESAKHIRVGDEYFKNIERPGKDGNLYQVLVPRSRQTVRDDTGSFFAEINKFEGFCNVPSHLDYKQEIGGHYNQYNKITHEPQKGNFENISTLLKHLFNTHYDFILDYFQLLYLEPTRRLPILLLESKERNTGKSTFGNLIRYIFQENAIKIGNSELSSDFNAIWAPKLLVVVDEASLNNDLIMEMIKRFSTETGKITINEKGRKQYQIEYFGKHIFISNQEGKALNIGKGENRFAVFKVPTLQASGLNDDPDIETKIKEEIPAFLYFLKSRELKYKQEASRMYFPFEAYKTDQLELYYRNSVSGVSKAVLDLLTYGFEIFSERQVLNFSAAELLNELIQTKRVKASTTAIQLKNAVENELGINLNKKGRYQFLSPFQYDLESIKDNYSGDSRNNRYYSFDRDKFGILE